MFEVVAFLQHELQKGLEDERWVFLAEMLMFIAKLREQLLDLFACPLRFRDDGVRRTSAPRTDLARIRLIGVGFEDRSVYRVARDDHTQDLLEDLIVALANVGEEVLASPAIERARTFPRLGGHGAGERNDLRAILAQSRRHRLHPRRERSGRHPACSCSCCSPSTSTSSPSTRTAYAFTGSTAGSVSARPGFTSKRAPWRGHSISSPSRFPSPSGPPSC